MPHSDLSQEAEQEEHVHRKLEARMHIIRHGEAKSCVACKARRELADEQDARQTIKYHNLKSQGREVPANLCEDMQPK